jgi:hypothetical protein
MRSNSIEQALVKEQVRRNVGIFQCDDAVVLSTEKVWLGVNPDGATVWAWVNPHRTWTHQRGDPAHISWHATDSWLNAGVFKNAFDTLVSSPVLWRNSWVAKVDPDAVFFADRLRLHIKPAFADEQVYWINCNMWGGKVIPDGGSVPGVGWDGRTYNVRGSMYGAVEVYSRGAMRAYREGKARCANDLHWHGWGEDLFMQTCMDLLGVQKKYDFKMVGDARCINAPCSDKSRVAFHPYKEPEAYLKCLAESSPEDPQVF